jgi:hypothetical protein
MSDNTNKAKIEKKNELKAAKKLEKLQKLAEKSGKKADDGKVDGVNVRIVPKCCACKFYNHEAGNHVCQNPKAEKFGGYTARKFSCGKFDLKKK